MVFPRTEGLAQVACLSTTRHQLILLGPQRLNQLKGGSMEVVQASLKIFGPGSIYSHPVVSHPRRCGGGWARALVCGCSDACAEIMSV